jgi:hypothetical protein
MKFPRRRNLSEAHRERKLGGVMIMFTILLLFLCVTLVSAAWEFDNVKDYDSKTNTISITNSFGFGKNVANITLNTPTIFKVMNGKDRKVAEFTIQNGEDYEDIFNKMEFYNLRNNNQEINRQFTYKIKSINGQRAKPIYETICTPTGVGNQTNCIEKLIRTDYIDSYEWDTFEVSEGLPKGEITIGVFTDVEPNDYVEWIPTLFGVEIDEWAVWIDDYYSGLEGYFTFNESSGTVALNSIDTFHNLTGLANNWVGGLIGNAHNVSNDMANSTLNNSVGDTNATLNFWINRTGGWITGNVILANNIIGGTKGEWEITQRADNSVSVYGLGNAGKTLLCLSDPLALNNWSMVTIIFNLTSMELFINATSCGVIGNPGFVFNQQSIAFFGYQTAGGTSTNFSMDEFAFYSNRTLTQSELTAFYNSGAGISPSVPIVISTVTTTLLNPIDASSFSTQDRIFNASYTSVNANLTNATFHIWNSNGSLFNRTETLVSGNDTTNYTFINITTLAIGNYIWNNFACSINATDTICDWAPANFTFQRNTIISSNISFNTTADETAIESFFLNLTTTGELPLSVRFFYNGTIYSSTNTGNDFNATFLNTISVPLGTGNKTFFWILNIGGGISNSTINNQTVNLTIFDLCNSTLDSDYINFTFKNETISQEDVNATIISSWVYTLGTFDVNKTLSFTNVTGNQNYAFCLDPPDERLNVILSMQYENAESIQREHTLTNALLTNITTNTVLYLLPTSLGIYTRYQTLTTTGDVISDVLATITRVIGGTSVNIGTGLTDSSGLISFFLNPSASYDYVFSKTGFDDNIFSLTPASSDIYVVTMGGGGSQNVSTGSQIVQNTTYAIFPVNSTLQNHTDVTFEFHVNSSQSINFMSMNLTNSSGFQLAFVSQASIGVITTTLNTGNHTRIIGFFEIQTANETIRATKIWIIGDFFEGDYSLNKQLRLFVNYDFNNFIRIALVLGSIFAVLLFLSGTEIIERPESQILVTILLIWVFSFVGWLDTGLIIDHPNQTVNILSTFSNKYGIAIVSSCFAAWAVLRKVKVI